MEKHFCLMIIVIVSTTLFAVIISDVQISPDTPSIVDLITVEVDGYIPGGGIHFDKSIFMANDLSLQLDLYFTAQTGPQIPQIWSHDEEIGTLLSGTYDLTVQAYWRASSNNGYILHDDYSTSFQVVPEPATVLLLSFGLLLLRKK